MNVAPGNARNKKLRLRPAPLGTRTLRMSFAPNSDVLSTDAAVPRHVSCVVLAACSTVSCAVTVAWFTVSWRKPGEDWLT